MTVLEMPRQVAPEALAAWRGLRSEVCAVAFAPRSTLTLSEWADQFRYLSADLGEPGLWRTDRVPYMRRPMDAITDPRVREVTIEKSARIGATQGLVLNSIGFYVDQEPSPIIVALPTKEDAQKFSTQLLQPMLDDTPCLSGRVESAKSKKRRSTMLQKAFPGGTLQIVGTTSPRAMRMVHGRIILMSEIDAYEFSAGVEGDPTKLLAKRAGTYGTPKFVKESTPLILQLSRIHPAFLNGSEEYYHVPCPHCGEYQRLVWGGRDTNYGIKWEKEGSIDERAATAHYVCQPNGCVIEQSAKHQMVARGQWVATHPERRTHLSFHMNALISPFDGARWPLLVKEWLEAQGKAEQIRVFVNTVLGEPWEDDGTQVDAHILAERYETYAAEVPERVAVLTRSVDVQGDRLETVVWGWGEGEECWPIEYELIPGDPGTPDPWKELDTMLSRTYEHESGAMLRPRVTFIDLGGHHTKQVYEFSRARQGLHVYAIQGANTEGAPLLSKPSRNNSAKAIVYRIGVFTAKEALTARLGKVTEPGPGYIHIPDWLDAEQLRQLTAEKLITRMVGGRPKREWVKTYERNEFGDLWNYGLGALQWLGPSTTRHLGAIAKQVAAEGERKRAESTDSPPSAMPRQQQPRRQSGWVNRWKL